MVLVGFFQKHLTIIKINLPYKKLKTKVKPKNKKYD